MFGSFRFALCYCVLMCFISYVWYSCNLIWLALPSSPWQGRMRTLLDTTLLGLKVSISTFKWSSVITVCLSMGLINHSQKEKFWYFYSRLLLLLLFSCNIWFWKFSASDSIWYISHLPILTCTDCKGVAVYTWERNSSLGCKTR